MSIYKDARDAEVHGLTEAFIRGIIDQDRFIDGLVVLDGPLANNIKQTKKNEFSTANYKDSLDRKIDSFIRSGFKVV